MSFFSNRMELHKKINKKRKRKKQKDFRVTSPTQTNVQPFPVLPQTFDNLLAKFQDCQNSLSSSSSPLSLCQPSFSFSLFLPAHETVQNGFPPFFVLNSWLSFLQTAPPSSFTTSLFFLPESSKEAYYYLFQRKRNRPTFPLFRTLFPFFCSPLTQEKTNLSCL